MPSLADCLPAYPLRFTHRQVVLWAIAELSDTPPLPGQPSQAKKRMRRLLERFVTDREHREQTKAWARAQGQEASFRLICQERGWHRGTALAHVDRALAMLLIVMNLDESAA